MPQPDYTLYVKKGHGPSNNTLSMINQGDRISVQPVEFDTINRRGVRPGWLRGVPTLVRFTPESDGVWRGPVWEGIRAIEKLRELCPKGLEAMRSSLATDEDNEVFDVVQGDGQTFIGMDAEPQDEGMTLDEGLCAIPDDAQCHLPVDGADNIDELNEHVRQCIERRQAELPDCDDE